MSGSDWQFVRRLASEKGVSLTDTGVNRRQTLGYAIDSVLVAAERKGA